MNVNYEEKPQKYWIIILLGTLTAIGPLSMDMYLPALPIVTADLDTTASLVQMSLTACLIGLAVGQLVFGPLSDIKGRKNPLLFTLAAYALVSVLCAFTENIWIFIFLRFIQGFTGAAGIVIARAAARDMFAGKELTKAFALLALVNGAAPILAPISGGFVLNFGSWPVVFLIIGAIGLLLLVSVALLFKETLHFDNRSEGDVFAVVKTFDVLFKDRTFMSIAFIQALIMSSMFAYIAGSPFVLQNIYDVTPQQFSLIFALNGVGIIVAAQLAGKLSGYMDEARILLIGVLISLLGSIGLIMIIILDLPLIPMILALFLVVSSVGLVSTTAFSMGMQNQRKSAGSASALLGLLPFIGGALVSPLVGLAGEQVAWPMGLVIIICSTGALLIFNLGIRMKKNVQHG
ncbi:multidrug effflux MFS transporter [Salinicoccus hispanicus]|uniref:Bcr/CflA family efflux transporter n=1 Tax=Salinicoccus hispanicus TaxID=157225 RepID=A0A6N8TVL9_9STAP|nr:multidrug effflux MFS transporter [Salinicoccus hispanicus]MXQ49968.1 Bcr/CflA family efflux MFS transporter [Salinicoccus hispanicus]